jgi:hypothetical protein
MPESVLAALIAGTATLSASFLQLRSALLRDAAANRGPSAAARRRNRLQLIILLVIIGAAAASGFALSQWLTAGERAAQSALQRELQARIAEIGRTANELELTRTSARAEIESDVLRRLGAEGIVVMATVPACRPAPAPATASGATAPANAAAAPPPAPGRACSESEASPVTLCASIPGSATVSEIALFSRLADSETPWSASRFLPGQESAEARFAENYSEGAPEGGVRQVCQSFTHWSAEHARAVRMIVHYALPG